VLRLPLTVDFDQVRATLLPAVASVEGVVQGPGPLLFFSDVGDAWINAKLIYWISDFGTQLRMADAVLTAAMISLREQKIEVAVPQLQVRSPAA
jgi:small-conductance mechanosensitive channel